MILPKPSRTLHSLPDCTGSGYFARLRRACNMHKCHTYCQRHFKYTKSKYEYQQHEYFHYYTTPYMQTLINLISETCMLLLMLCRKVKQNLYNHIFTATCKGHGLISDKQEFILAYNKQFYCTLSHYTRSMHYVSKND